MLDTPESVRRMSELGSLLDTFKSRRDAAQAAVDRLNQIIKLLEEAQATLHASAPYDASAPSEFAVALKTPLRVRGIVAPTEIAALAKTILRENGRPMKRGELIAEMERRNIPLAGSNRNKNLGTILWRHRNEFAHIEKRGYWIKGLPLPGVYEHDD